ncbi:MAG: FecR family protein [Candidatus Omnitrophota bacterium]
MAKKFSFAHGVWFFGLMFFSGSAVAFAEPVTLQEMKGEVQILKKGQVDWTPATQGMTLEAGDRVQTLEKAKAVLVFSHGRVDLDEKTDYGIDQMENASGLVTATTSLNLGKLKAKIEKMKAGSEFKITTPTSVATVRGTFLGMWVFQFQGNLFTYLDVFDGIVGFSNLDGSGGGDYGPGEHVTGGGDGNTGGGDDGGGTGDGSGDDSDDDGGDDDSGDDLGGDDLGGDDLGDDDLGGFFEGQGGYEQDTFGSQDSESGLPGGLSGDDSGSGDNSGYDDDYSGDDSISDDSDDTGPT